MTDEEAAAEIREWLDCDDIELVGVEIDALLVRLLRELGYEKTAEAYENAALWRA